MTSSISFGGAIASNASPKDIENIAKYTVGTTLVNSDEGPLTGSGLMLGLTGLYETGKVGKHFFDARKEKGGVSNAWQNEKDIFTKELNVQKDLMKDGGWKKAGTYKQLWNNYENKINVESIPTGDALKKLSPEAKEAYKVADAAVKAAQSAPADSELLSIANKSIAKANVAARVGTEATGFFGKIGSFIGKYTGYSKVTGSIEKLAVDSPTLAKVMKLGKGSGPFLAITGAIELATQVIPTFVQLGPVKGVEQLFKSSAKTIASVGGWAAGAAAGAAIGSVIPGAGTAIGGAVGALIGFVGGCVGSWGASKVTEKVVGKNELEIAEDDKAKELTKATMQNPDQIDTLIAAAGQKIQENGVSSKDDQIALASLKRIAAQRQAIQQTQSTQSNQSNGLPQVSGFTKATGLVQSPQQIAINPNDTFNPFRNGTNQNQ